MDGENKQESNKTLETRLSTYTGVWGVLPRLGALGSQSPPQLCHASRRTQWSSTMHDLNAETKDR